MRRSTRWRGPGPGGRLRGILGAASRPMLGFDEPWDDRQISGAFIDEAIEQLYGARRRGRRASGRGRND